MYVFKCVGYGPREYMISFLYLRAGGWKEVLSFWRGNVLSDQGLTFSEMSQHPGSTRCRLFFYAAVEERSTSARYFHLRNSRLCANARSRLQASVCA